MSRRSSAFLNDDATTVVGHNPRVSSDNNAPSPSNHDVATPTTSNAEVHDQSEFPSDLEKAQSPTIDKEKPPEQDPNIVTWDGPNDPNNPRNWPFKQRWIVTLTVSSFTLMRYVYVITISIRSREQCLTSA